MNKSKMEFGKVLIILYKLLIIYKSHNENRNELKINNESIYQLIDVKNIGAS